MNLTSNNNTLFESCLTKPLKNSKQKYIDNLKSLNINKLKKSGSYQNSNLISKYISMDWTSCHYEISLEEKEDKYLINYYPGGENRPKNFKSQNIDFVPSSIFKNIEECQDMFSIVNLIENEFNPYLKVKKSINKPIYVNYKFESKNNVILYPLLTIEIEKDCPNLDIIQQVDTNNNSVFINSQINIINDENSNVNFCSNISKNNNFLNFVNNISVICKKKSNFESIILNSQGLELKNNFFVTLSQEEAKANLYSSFSASENRVVDNMTLVRHLAPDTSSNQLYKGVAKDNSKGNFFGKIFVDRIAQKTKAYQNSRNLILSDKSRINTNPQLEIFADDVKCSHGATISQLNEEHLFYLQTRGLSYEDAKKSLIEAFLKEPTLNLGSEYIKTYIESIKSRD